MKNIHPLTTEQMKGLCQLLRNDLVEAKVIGIAAPSRSRFSLVLQSHDEVKALFFCFDPPFVRFHLLRNRPSLKGLFSHPLQTYLENATVDSIEMLNQDRILKIGFGSLTLIGEFFPKRPNCYLLDTQEKILFSIYPLKDSHYHLPTRPSYVPQSSTPLSHQDVELGYRQLEEEEAFTQAKTQLQSHYKQNIKKLLHRQEKLHRALEECATWKKVLHEGELLKANFAALKRGEDTITVWDWESERETTLELDPKKTPQQELSVRFRRAKKLEAGLTHLHQQLDSISQELQKIEGLLHQLEGTQTINELTPFTLQKKQMTRTEEEKKLPYHEYISAAGIKIWVGKNAKSNDQLTFSLASGSDWWMHVQDYPGSHVVIKTRKGVEPDSDTLVDAMQLALHYSKAKKHGEGEICLTQRKYLSRFGKEVGKVQVSKHKTLKIRVDPERLKSLNERTNILDK